MILTLFCVCLLQCWLLGCGDEVLQLISYIFRHGLGLQRGDVVCRVFVPALA